jgi:hypothetical protein
MGADIFKKMFSLIYFLFSFKVSFTPLPYALEFTQISQKPQGHLHAAL